MLTIEQGNRLEQLATSLVARLIATDEDPLQSQQVVVPNPGMGRWLVQQMAEQDGIAANLSLPLPASFFWQLFRAWLPDQRDALFDREALAWRVRARLPGLLSHAEFAPLQRYLDGPAEPALRLFELGDRIADVFDQYLVFRPELLLAWEAGKSVSGWQSLLWQAINQEGKTHRARLLRQLLDAMEGAPVDEEALPPRIFFFGLNALPPVYLEILRRLARHRDVYFYHLNPCREYWADLRDERSLAHHQVPQEAFLELGNPLLASMGHVGQVFLDQLLSLDADIRENYLVPEEEGVLQDIQTDILVLQDGRDTPGSLPESVWPSLQFHGTHTRFREVQVLHDNLLRCFEELDDLHPRDILVMAPDMAVYAPFVEAVFAAADGERHIPYSIGDRSVEGENPLGEALRWLLRLPGCRFPASEVLALLEVEALQHRLDLDEEALERMRTWVRETGIRWGLDATQREELGLPGADGLHSWRFGLRRLFLGYVTPVEDESLLYGDGTAPYDDIQGHELLWAGAMQQLLDRLDHWRRQLAKSYTLAQWRDLLSSLMDAFFLVEDEQDAQLLFALRQRLDELVAQSEENDFRDALPLPVVRRLLEDTLEDNASARGFLHGGVTFSNLLPMRALPFRVICLLGMNDSDFPRQQRRPSFDLMASHPRRADRDRRRDDRYLFLETLVSARDCLLISWQSRDVRSDKERLPAEVVSELMDYLDGRYDMRGEPASRYLWTQHPLQPFSTAYFDTAQPRYFSYDASWLIHSSTPMGPSFISDPLPAPVLEELDIGELLQFLRNPARVFLMRNLAMRLPGEEEQLLDSEPFRLESLDQWVLKDRLLQTLVWEDDPEQTLAYLRAEGRLPHGLPGYFEEQAALEPVEELHEYLAPLLAETPLQSPLALDIVLDGIHLGGQLTGYTGQGVLKYRVGRLRACDVLELWLYHLGVALQRGQAMQSRYVTLDEQLVLGKLEANEAREHLSDLLGFYRQGLAEPFFFAPETAWRLVNEDRKWQQAWEGSYNRKGEREDRAWQLVGGDEDRLNDRFQANARAVFDPLLAHRLEEA